MVEWFCNPSPFSSASDPDGSIVRNLWTFDDGDFSYEQNPTKVFYAPGTYHVHLAVQDDSGNTVLRTLTIVVRVPAAMVSPFALSLDKLFHSWRVGAVKSRFY